MRSLDLDFLCVSEDRIFRFWIFTLWGLDLDLCRSKIILIVLNIAWCRGKKVKDIDDSKWESKGDGSVVVRVQPPGTVSHPILYRYRYVGYRYRYVVFVYRTTSYLKGWQLWAEAVLYQGVHRVSLYPLSRFAPARHTFPVRQLITVAFFIFC